MGEYYFLVDADTYSPEGRKAFFDKLVVMPRRFGKGAFKDDLKAFTAELRDVAGGWDVAIDFQGLAKSGLVTWQSKARRRIGFSRSVSREGNFLFMNERVTPRARAVIRMNLELLRPLGIEASEPVAVLHETTEDTAHIEAWTRQSGIEGERFLVVDPFAGWVTKVWEKPKWVEVMRRVEQETGLRSIVFWGPGEQADAQALAGAVREQGCRPLVAPPTTLRQYSALVRRCAAAMIGGDTGPMHMAAALGIPTVALFGASDSRRNAPCFAGARFETLQDFGQPCAGTFARTCKFHDPGTCMRGIWAAAAIEALQRVLGKGQ